jgi:dihydroorotase
MSRTVVRGGKIVDPASGLEAERDILVEDGVIRAIEKTGGFGKLESAMELDAKGRLVLPGAIDLHVHFRDPGYEWKETIKTGSQAAVRIRKSIYFS